MRVGSRDIEISSPDKVFFPDAGITKGDLVDYYVRIAPTMLRHVRGRLVMMHRFPDGIAEEGFYHKDVPEYFPEWIPRVEVEKEDGTLQQLVCDEAACLAYLADQGTITPHVWLSPAEDLRHPDRLVFDLDPPGEGGFDRVVEAARVLVELYAEIDVTPFLMTTGSRGLHVVVPLDRSAGFDDARALARSIAEEAQRRRPGRFTTAARKRKRHGRLYLDVTRNAYAQTTVAPYGVRAKPGAPVATPIRPDELDDPDLGPQRWRMENIFLRLGQLDDPWADIARHAVSVGAVSTRLRKRAGG